MHYFIDIIGIVGAFFILKYRERAAEILGEPEWMKAIGGVYNVVIYIAIFVFFWSIADMTNTLQYIFWPLRYLFIQGQNTPQPNF